MKRTQFNKKKTDTDRTTDR